MRLRPTVLNINPSEVDKRIQMFIRNHVVKAKAKGIVLGLSGGIDSCTVAALSAQAIGGDNTLGLMMPESETCNSRDIEHARLVARQFHLKTEIIDITTPLETLYKSIPKFDSLERRSKGNIKARIRMIYLYYYANRLNMLVCGSSDKSETMMGYFTKWGDVAADIWPIMDLYKTQVRRLAKHIDISEEIVNKPSSPALWPNQLAEDELGIEYELLDLVLYGFEHFMTPTEIAAELQIDKRTVDMLKCRWLQAEHKRRTLLTVKLEYRTIGTDFRLPRGAL